MKKHFSSLSNNGVIYIVISALTLITSVFISEMQTKAGWIIVIISLIYVLICFLILSKFLLYPLSKKIDTINNETLNSDLTILSQEKMAVFESNEELKELWIISSDLAFDSDGGVFKDVVSSNLNKGVKYLYFIPCNQVSRSREHQIKKHNKSNKNLKFIYLNDDFFFFAPNLDCVLHFYKNDKPNDGFIGLTMNANRYYIKMSNELFHATYGNLFPHIEDDMDNCQPPTSGLAQGGV
jgi:c-di-AMP phosphodiesterase-like protein